MNPQSRRRICIIVAIALAIKLSLFVFAAIHAPQGKLLPDSNRYIELAKTLATKGVFASQSENGGLVYETLRTPGYPIFLAALYGLAKIPLDGIVLLQILMTLAVAFVVYKTAVEIDPNIVVLSMAIILLDPPTMIFSMTILTEPLFLLGISIFMFNFVLYLKCKKIGYLVISAFMLVMATYIRPVSYYLGFMIMFFIIYANRKEGLKKLFAHALIFVLIVYSLLGIWQIRNHIRCHSFVFSSMQGENSGKGLIRSYARHNDPHTKGMTPLPYYVNVSFRSLLSVLTKPGHFKYFQSEQLRIGGYIFSYPFMAFWLTGFICGVAAMRRNAYLHFMLFVTLYFITASVVGQMWAMGDRLRVSAMPFIAIISAYGWCSIIEQVRKNRSGNG
ncbi:MAG: hypothetical protein A3C51_02165 [Omnitrophica bacterium RIFCSPHIGHO2_02_FULL_46_20]|nr:MAG: hypothetical protein A3C51_02165 [Omnitrophica bacterium RIFCSPHIGHO2_02_FULL_46_20]